MPVRLIGLSHHTAPIEVRELLAFPTAQAVAGALERVKASLPNGGECAVLSTCNRTELYMAGSDRIQLADAVSALLPAPDASALSDRVIPYFEERRGQGAVERLFRVTAGLESMMLGEMDIVRQVKDAYSTASDAGTVGATLNPLFHEALRVGKRARTETALGRGAFGIGHAAATVAESIFGSLNGRIALILGAGAMSETTARHLAAVGVSTILVANRTYDRAAALAESLGGRAVHYDALEEHLVTADIVIASTASPHAVVTYRTVQGILRRRRNRPLYFIDIAVPRDIEPRVGDLDNVFLYNIDHFQAVVDADLAERKEQAEQATRIVAEEAQAFTERLRVSRAAAPLIGAVRHKLEDVSNSELKRLRKRLSHLSESDWAEIEAFARSVQNKIAHAPSTRIREYAESDAIEKLDAARELFAVDTRWQHTSRAPGVSEMDEAAGELRDHES